MNQSTRSTRLLLAMSVIGLGAAVVRGLSEPKNTLRGLHGVAVSASRRDTGDMGLPPEYEESVKARLRAAGIPILPYDNDAPGHPVLLVIVGDREDRVDLELRQDVVLDRDKEVSARATTWWTGFSMRSKNQVTDPVLTTLVERFINDYFDANPRQRR